MLAWPRPDPRVTNEGGAKMGVMLGGRNCLGRVPYWESTTGAAPAGPAGVPAAAGGSMAPAGSRPTPYASDALITASADARIRSGSAAAPGSGSRLRWL